MINAYAPGEGDQQQGRLSGPGRRLLAGRGSDGQEDEGHQPDEQART